MNNLHVVTDGTAAMDFIYQRGEYTDAPRPDLILLDLNLPKKDGHKVLNEVKANPKLRTIPVIILTTQTSTRTSWSRTVTKRTRLSPSPSTSTTATMVRTIDDFWLTFVKLQHKPTS